MSTSIFSDTLILIKYILFELPKYTKLNMDINLQKFQKKKYRAFNKNRQSTYRLIKFIKKIFFQLITFVDAKNILIRKKIVKCIVIFFLTLD